ncbi:MAG TPA: hypothetical protein VIV27_01065, partial [Halioglobus sp.]
MAGLFRRRKPAGRTKPRIEPTLAPTRAPERSRVKRPARRPAQGATRNPEVAAANAAKAGRSSAWFNRLLILLGAGVVLAAATK